MEGKENFTLTISPSSLPSNITRGNLAQTTIKIGDDDCKCIMVANIHFQTTYGGLHGVYDVRVGSLVDAQRTLVHYIPIHYIIIM